MALLDHERNEHEATPLLFLSLRLPPPSSTGAQALKAVQIETFDSAGEIFGSSAPTSPFLPYANPFFLCRPGDADGGQRQEEGQEIVRD